MIRRCALPLLTVVLTGAVLTACTGADPEAAPPPVTSVSPGAPGASPAATPATPASEPDPLTCAQLRDAQVQDATIKLADYPRDSMQLTGGVWTASDGTTVELQEPCGIGDLTGDGRADALGAVKITTGGTGRFYALVAWRNNGGTPVLAATLALGDRTPVAGITISGDHATVVYLTRNDGEPMAALTIERTATFALSAGTLTEISRTDSPYSPS